ncbi:MAG: Zn-dependent hydrolase [Bacteroidales bacterium]|nr:Zn-dependent hydrolase [Bacteroidales bacterium]
MKIQTILLISIFVLLYSCNSEKHDYLYQSFSGTHPASEIIDEQGNTQTLPASEILVRIDQKQLYFQNEPLSYIIEDDNTDFVLLSAQGSHDGKTATLRFKYMKNNEELVFLHKDGTENIFLHSDAKILENKLNSFTSVSLETNINHLSDNQQEMIKIFFRIADIINEIYWVEAYGDKDELMETTDDPVLRSLYAINYGPWERLNDNKPFLSQFGQKPSGANFYPKDMTKEEFETFDSPDKSNLYTILRRTPEGGLKSIPYHEYFKEEVEQISDLLLEAAALAEDEGFKSYLEKRSAAFLTDDYYESDVAWMEMKNNKIDFVVGPIENYEDNLFNYKAAHESFILIKDLAWSEKLSKLTGLLPQLQKELPVEAKFKTETPGTGSDLNVYDVVFYSGDCNAGSKTIAINLPNDPKVRANYGSRKLQLKNSIQAKFEKILVPISNVLIDESQRQYIDFDAFFENTMFHEVAHGLGMDYTINNKGTVREALLDCYSPIEEGKADILGLYIATKLIEMGELGEKDVRNNYVTFMASIFRSVRFGAASAHGNANMMKFYYFQEAGAFTRDEISGTYKVDFDKMKAAMLGLTNEIIEIQGLGDYGRASNFIIEKGFIRTQLQNDLNRLKEMAIPVDIVFEQGPELLGL